MLIAYRHDTKRSHVAHLRCHQTEFSEAKKERLQRVGSPAVWTHAESAWDWPLTAAAVVALAEAAKDLGEEIEWRDGLQEFAAAHLKQDELEHQTRLAMERIIRDPAVPLDAYACITTNPFTGEACPPTRYQQIAYHWSLRVGGLYLAWDPGVGKTRGAVDAAGGWYRLGLIPMMQSTFINGKPGVTGGILIICPKTMMKTWQRELALWQNMTGIIISGDAAKKKRLAGTAAHAHICNYESLSYVADNHYAGLIPDEIHRCANNSTQTERTMGLAQRATKRLGLSGTPITNALESIFYQMLIIDQGKALGPSRTRFLEKFFREEVTHGGFVKNIPKEESVSAVSAAMARSTYFIKKEEALPFLPAKTHTPITIEMTDEQARYYKELEREAHLYIQDATVTVEQASAKMMKLLQLAQGFVLTDDGTGRHFSDAKTQLLMETLTGELAGKKVILWTYFQYESQRIAELLREARIPFVRIDGTITSQRARDAAVDRFNDDPSLLVFVRQLSMSEGVTLTAKDCETPCHESIYMGLSYRLVDWKQSQDRIHRLGQKYHCSYRYFLTENCVDRKVFNSVLDKSNIADAVHEEGKSFYAQLLSQPEDKVA
jgi:SNF2 family DNA or RNA helicase